MSVTQQLLSVLLPHRALSQVHDPKVLSLGYPKTWAQDSYHTFHRRKTFHSGLSSWRDLTQKLWTLANPTPPLQGTLLSLASSNRYIKQGIHLKQAGVHCSPNRHVTPPLYRKEG